MPVLRKSDFGATVTWLGLVTDREAGLTSSACCEIDATFSGPKGESHCGLVVPSCARMRDQYPVGTSIRNTRQISIICADQLDEIAGIMGLERLDPSLIGANMVVRGIPDFAHIPPSSRLQFASGATLVVNLQNRPCHLPAKPIEANHPGTGAGFKPAANGLRGIVAWVEQEGMIQLGDEMTLHIPDQRAWSPVEKG